MCRSISSSDFTVQRYDNFLNYEQSLPKPSHILSILGQFHAKTSSHSDRKTIRIKSILESEGNKETQDDKFNRVDMIAEDELGELMIFEIQNNRELDYFHRMAYGTSKAMSEYLKEGEAYRNIKKIYSINIVYFSLGQGKEIL